MGPNLASYPNSSPLQTGGGAGCCGCGSWKKVNERVKKDRKVDMVKKIKNKKKKR